MTWRHIPCMTRSHGPTMMFFDGDNKEIQPGSSLPKLFNHFNEFEWSYLSMFMILLDLFSLYFWTNALCHIWILSIRSDPFLELPKVCFAKNRSVLVNLETERICKIRLTMATTMAMAMMIWAERLIPTMTNYYYGGNLSATMMVGCVYKQRWQIWYVYK